LSKGVETPLVGVVPAAGRATRLPELPCSKEIFPLHAPAPLGRLGRLPTPCERLLASMATGGAWRAYVVVGRGKWDIPAYLGAGSRVGLPLGYVTAFDSPSSAATVDAAYSFLDDSWVMLGFPDIVFEPHDAFSELVRRLRATAADVVLGLFPARRPEKVDMVDVAPDGSVREIVVKPVQTHLELAWITAAWKPSFTDYLHRHMRGFPPRDRELYVGDVIRAALERGVAVDSVTFAAGDFYDIGTSEELAETLDAVRRR
jgi:glucose-1-phosphate thymidylyltransferase